MSFPVLTTSHNPDRTHHPTPNRIHQLSRASHGVTADLACPHIKPVTAALTQRGIATVTAARAQSRPGPACAAPTSSQADSVPDQPLAPAGPAVPRQLYAAVVARPLLDGRVATVSAFSALQAERPPNDIAAARIRSEILPLLRQMLDAAESVRIDDPEVRSVHEHAIAGAQLQVGGFEMVATALEQNDASLLQQGSELLAAGDREWGQWAAGVEGL